MNVSEMENLIQQITDQICQQLLSSSYSVALAEAKEAFPEEMFVRFPESFVSNDISIVNF